MSKKPYCYNCKHASRQFKIAKLTHLHCLNKKKYPEDNEISAWDTLRVFGESCKDHEFLTNNKQQ